LPAATRHGQLVSYHRKTHTRIRHPLGSAAFVAEVERLNKHVVPERIEVMPLIRTLDSLTAAYRASPEFLNLAERTRRDYQGIFDYLQPLASDPFGGFDAAAVIEIRDHGFKKRKRHYANYVLTVLRLLLAWVVDHGQMTTNPAKQVKKLKKSKEEAKKVANRMGGLGSRRVIDAATGGANVILALGRWACAREGYAVDMQRKHYDGKWLRWTQSKTGEDIEMPVHLRLKTILDEAPA
jgi:hypothetical protein